MKQLTTFLVFWLVAISGHGQTMTLAECVDVGIAHNLQLSNARIGIVKGHLGVTQNRSRLLPVIQGVAQFTDYVKNPVNVTTGTLLDNDFSDAPTWQKIKSMKYQTSTGILLNVPVYNQTILLGIDVAKTVESIQGLSYEKAKEELTMQNTLHEQQLNMLRYLMDMSMDAPLDVTPMDSTFQSQPVGSVSNTLPELLLAEKRRLLVGQQIKTVKAGYLPTLSLTGYIGGLGYNEKFHQFTDHWFGNCYLGLSLRVPIFEANSKHLKIKQYRYDAQQTQNDLDLLRRQTEKSYADAILRMNRNIEIMRTQNECRKQAEEVYKIAEVQYKEGVASMTALLQDDMQLRSTQSACLQAVCQCKLAQLDLLRLSGRLEELK